MEKRIPPIHPEETKRLLSVLEYNILDTQNDEQLDGLTELVATIFNVPIALITILDEKRQWFKSNFGLSIRETERTISFCQYTIMADALYEVHDARVDETFKENPLVTGSPFIRYYCGAPLKNERGFLMGSLAIIDTVPRQIDEQQKKQLKLLAQTVVNHFELGLKRKELEIQKALLEKTVDERTGELRHVVRELKQRDEKIVSINNELSRLIYKASHDLLGPIKTIQGLIALGKREKDAQNFSQYLNLIGLTTRKLDQALVNLLKVITIKDPSEFTTVVWEFLIRHAENMARKRVEGKTLFVNAEVCTEQKFRSDNALLQMILEELFVNSMQYNRNEDVIIKVRITQGRDSIALDIFDNGIGIREDEKVRIFEMFFKNSKSRGSGLGLYIVKSAVEKLNGTIHAESKANEGTCIHIRFPMENTRKEPKLNL